MLTLRARIGEISLMKDLTKTMEIMKEAEDGDESESEDAPPKKVNDDAAAGAATAGPSDKPATTEPTASASTDAPAAFHSAPSSLAPEEKDVPTRSAASTPRPGQVPTRMMLTNKSDEEMREVEGMTEQEQELRRKEKKKGLSKEQRDELAAYEAERKRVRQERVDNLAKKLVDRLCVWTETDKTAETTHAFNEKTRYEAENLKMESFGIDILHGEHILVMPHASV
jgi:hypothetical protein